MADIASILKALANWQPTGPVSKDQLAQGFGRSSHFATFDPKPEQGMQYAAQGPGGGGMGAGIDLMGHEQAEAAIPEAPEVQQFNPEPLPQGQELPDPALMAALNQAQPWERSYAGAQHTPQPWAAPMPRINLGNIDVQGTGTPENPEFGTVSPQFAIGDNTEDDMMRRSREYQDMVLNLLARSRGNG